MVRRPTRLVGLLWTVVALMVVATAPALAADVPAAEQVTVQQAPTIVGPTDLSADYGEPFAQPYTMSGDPAPTASWNGNVPPGLTIDPATARISGVPTADGVYQFTITADNHVSPAATLPVTITVNRPTGLSGTPPAALIGVPYSFQFTVTGYPVPIVSLDVASTLPPGLDLDTSGRLYGIPTETGTFPFVLDAFGSGLVKLPVTLAVVTAAPTLSGKSEDVWGVGQPYNYRFTLAGGPPPKVSVAGQLPPGLSLDPDTATLSGTPTLGGVYSVTLTAANGVQPDAVLDFSMTIYQAAGITGDPPNGIVGQPYAYQFGLTGYPASGVAVKAGSALPPGLTLTEPGLLSGTPTAFGSFTFTLTAKNDLGSQDLSVGMEVRTVPTVTTTSLPEGQVGVAYRAQLQATGTVPITWVLAPGSNPLPADLNLDGEFGSISGTPSVASTTTITVQAVNYLGRSAPQPLTITIRPAGLGEEGPPTATPTGTTTPTTTPTGATPTGTPGATVGLTDSSSTGASASSSTSSLARTGSDAGALVVAALVSLLLGTGLVLVRRFAGRPQDH